MTYLHGDHARVRGLVLQGMKVKAVVFEGNPCVAGPSFLLMDSKHTTCLQQSLGGFSWAAEVLGLQDMRRR